MRWVMTSLFDVKAQTYTLPLTSRTVGEAIRVANNLVNQTGDNMYRINASDFDLILLGYFDDESGVMENANHDHLGNLSQWKVEPEDGPLLKAMEKGRK